MVRKLITFIVIIILSLGLVFFWALHQPVFWTHWASYLLKQRSIDVKEMTIDAVQWSTLTKVVFDNVHLKCIINKTPYLWKAAYIKMDNLNSLVTHGPVLVTIKNFSVGSNVLNMAEAQALAQCYFDYLYYHVQAYGYGGQIASYGWLKYRDGLSYNIKIQLQKINSVLLAQVNPVFGPLQANIDGDIQIQHPDGKRLTIQSHLHCPRGGRMKASLLRYLAQYVPQRQQIEALISQDKDVLLSDIEANGHSLSQDRFSFAVLLKSSTLNLNMNVRFDLHVEGGLEHLLTYLKSPARANGPSGGALKGEHHEG